MIGGEWIRELKLEQLPSPYPGIAEAIGLENTLKLAILVQGTGVYFPKLDSALAEIRNQRIRAEFDGYNQKTLAIKYGITERWVYEIVGREEDESQVRFF